MVSQSLRYFVVYVVNMIFRVCFDIFWTNFHFHYWTLKSSRMCSLFFWWLVLLKKKYFVESRNYYENVVFHYVYLKIEIESYMISVAPFTDHYSIDYIYPSTVSLCCDLNFLLVWFGFVWFGLVPFYVNLYWFFYV